MQDILCIEGNRVRAVSVERTEADMPLTAFMTKVAPADVVSTGNMLVPDGCRGIFTRGPMTIAVQEVPGPRIYELTWIAKNSPVPYGPKARYRPVRIALPFVLVFAVYGVDGKRLRLSQRNEIFFANAPLSSLDEEVRFPCLLNASRYNTIDMPGKGLSWICTQNYHPPHINGTEDIPASVNGLIHYVLGARHNLSSEASPIAKASKEHSSWFTEHVARNVDARISSIERWEEESFSPDPSWVLTVPWIPTGYTVRGIVDRIFRNYCPPRKTPTSADLARIVFNQGRSAGADVPWPHRMF